MLAVRLSCAKAHKLAKLCACLIQLAALDWRMPASWVVVASRPHQVPQAAVISSEAAGWPVIWAANLAIVAQPHVALQEIAQSDSSRIQSWTASCWACIDAEQAHVSRIWGLQNREAPIRLIEDTALGPEVVSNVELKCLDSTINPYIALTAIAQAGMLGLQNSTRLPPKCQADPGSPVWTQVL